MLKIKDGPIVYCDVDDTLVMWQEFEELEGTALAFRSGSEYVYCFPHTKHIELLKQFKARGHTVVVWSQGGSDWAEEVVKMLELENVVDLVIPKPYWYIDDLHANQFMSDSLRIYKDYK